MWYSDGNGVVEIPAGLTQLIDRAKSMGFVEFHTKPTMREAKDIVKMWNAIPYWEADDELG